MVQIQIWFKKIMNFFFSYLCSYMTSKCESNINNNHSMVYGDPRKALKKDYVKGLWNKFLDCQMVFHELHILSYSVWGLNLEKKVHNLWIYISQGWHRKWMWWYYCKNIRLEVKEQLTWAFEYGEMPIVGQVMFLMDIGMDIYTSKKLDKKALFVDKWVNVVVKYETILENEAQWLMLESLLSGKVVS